MSDYSIWVLEYAMSRLPHERHHLRRANEGHRKLPYGYVLIKGKDKVAMVDVGFNNKDSAPSSPRCSASRTGIAARRSWPNAT